MMDTAPATVAVAAAEAGQLKQAALLAKRLRLPLVPATSRQRPFVLLVTPQRLELRRTDPGGAGPVYVDFTSGNLTYRRKHGGGRRQALARAVGLKGTPPTVFDATGGLGRDAFILACLGCPVHLVERSPVVHALLADGLKRAEADAAIGTIVRQRFSLTLDDSRTMLARMAGKRPEVIYLDPMYPHRSKTALVKKEMRFLRAVVGDDTDAAELLASALSRAEKRVVVKRPKGAPNIDGPRPDLIITGKNSRFDIYLTTTGSSRARQ